MNICQIFNIFNIVYIKLFYILWLCVFAKYKPKTKTKLKCQKSNGKKSHKIHMFLCDRTNDKKKKLGFGGASLMLSILPLVYTPHSA